MINPSIYEILQFATNMEEEGERFYRHHAASYTGQVRSTFLRLASDEVEHATYFKKLYNLLEQKSDNEYLFEESVISYFKNYAKVSTFDREMKALKYEDVVNEGIKTEESTIEFYTNLKGYATDSTKEMLERIISEEQKHVTLLRDLLSENA